MNKRVFYVIYFTNNDVQKCLDAIKFLCNPFEKREAHITVRGPYSQRYDMSALSQQIKGSKVDIRGAGCFFENSQNTVFLRCNSSKLKRVWKKRDYEYNPHITIYDGDSREFANALIECLQNLDLNFAAEVDGLSCLVSIKGQQSTELRSAFDNIFISKILGKFVNGEELMHADTLIRINYIRRISQYLAEICRKSPSSYGVEGFESLHPSRIHPHY